MPLPFGHSQENLFSLAARANPQIQSAFNEINLENPTYRDRRIIDEIDRLLPQISADKNALAGWDIVRNKILDGIAKLQTRRSILSAMLVAGAAITQKDIDFELRSDVSDSLKLLRFAYQADIRNNRIPSLQSSEFSNIGQRFLTNPSLIHEQVSFHIMAQGFEILNRSIKKGGRVDTAINALLRDNTKTLFKGKDWESLDLLKLNNAYQEHFGKAIRVYTERKAKDKDKSKVRLSYAPGATSLSSASFHCLNRLDGPGDDVFWMGYYYSLKNVEEVYEQIDEAMKNTINDVELNLKWTHKPWKTQLYKNIRESTDATNCNTSIGQMNIFNGFAPWIASIIGIEDDDAEYKEIQDMVDTIGDVAEVVSTSAQTIAAISGPTPAGVAAASVTCGAQMVSTAADVTNAVLDIVNYLDQDDSLGFSSCHGQGDYAQDHPFYVKMALPKTTKSSTDVKTSKSHYKFSVEESLGGEQSKFERCWIYREVYAAGKTRNRTLTWKNGGNGDDPIKISFPAGSTVSEIMASDVDDNGGSGKGHAEWKKPPQLIDNNSAAQGKVHWGVTRWYELSYTPWVLGGTFIKPTEEVHRTTQNEE